MDGDIVVYTTVLNKSSCDKKFLGDIQNKTNFIEGRLNNNAKVLGEIRNSITDTYELYEKIIRKDPEKLEKLDKLENMENIKKINSLESRLANIELKFIDLKNQMETLLEFTEKFMK